MELRLHTFKCNYFGVCVQKLFGVVNELNGFTLEEEVITRA